MTTKVAKSEDLNRPPDPGLGLSSCAYAESLRTNIKWDSHLKQNILEMMVESDNGEFIDIPDGEVERLFKTIGMNGKTQVEGYFRHEVF